MNNSEIYSHVDHTLLKAYASWEEIKKLCDEAVQYRTASVCIPPSYIRRVRENYGKDFRICTVVGFPLGYSTKEVKVSETLLAVKNGADEIDTVINLGDVKNKEYGQILAELKAIRAAAEGRILKVIIETCYLTEERSGSCAAWSPSREPITLRLLPDLERKGRCWRIFSCLRRKSDRT